MKYKNNFEDPCGQPYFYTRLKKGSMRNKYINSEKFKRNGIIKIQGPL